MATRKIIDIEQNGEKVWPKGHAKATFMSDGTTVEDSINSKVTKVDGKQLSTEDFTTILKTKLEGLNNYDDTELSEVLSTLREDFDKLVSGDTTAAIKSFNDVIAFLDGIQDTQDLSSIIASIQQQIAGKMDKVTLATVATSGSYNDLTNKPTIPSAVTESTVSGWGFTKNAGTYSKPSTGIPKTDLASAVQTSLGKADTALQSYTEQYRGTVTKVKINGDEKSPDSNGVVDLGTIESGNGGNIVELLDADVDIELNDTIDTIICSNKLSSLSVSLEQPSFDKQWTIIFRSSANTSLTMPDEAAWPNGEAPQIEADMEYELSIRYTPFNYATNSEKMVRCVLAGFKRP
jgi:hypothetical protein